MKPVDAGSDSTRAIGASHQKESRDGQSMGGPRHHEPEALPHGAGPSAGGGACADGNGNWPTNGSGWRFNPLPA